MGAAGAFGGGRKIWFFPAFTLVLAVSFAAVGFAAETKSSDRLSELIKLVGLDTAFNHAAAGMKAGADRALANTSSTLPIRKKCLALGVRQLMLLLRPKPCSATFSSRW